MKKIAVHTTVALELLATLSLSRLAFLFSGWFLNDDLAAELRGIGWVIIGAQRVLFFLVVASIISLVLFWMNSHLFKGVRLQKSRVAAIAISVFIFFCIVFSSVAGAFFFIQDKPFV